MPSTSKPFMSSRLASRGRNRVRGGPPTDMSVPNGYDQRRELGEWLQQKRIQADLTQEQLGELLAEPGGKPLRGTAISMVEMGRNPVPVERYEEWAEALGLDREDFGKRLLKAYNPWLFSMLFERRRKSIKSSANAK